MFLTGRATLLVGIGVPVVVAWTLVAGGGAGAAWAATGVWLALCALLVALDVARAASPAALRVQRDVPARVRRDEIVETTVSITNTGPRTLRGLVRDGWEPTAGVAAGRIPVLIPAGERRVLRVGLRPRRRGVRRAAFVAVRSLGPLGLSGRQRVLPAPAELRVLPPFRARAHLPSRLQRLRELDGATSVLVRGQGTEFDSLREYVRGDDVRSIDWRATARSRTTMIRTWRPERDRHVVIVVDTGRTAAARAGDETRLDASIEAMLLLAALADQAGDQVHVLAFDRVSRARVSGVRGAALLPALSNAFATVEPRLIDTGWEAALVEAASLYARPSLLVLLTAADAPASSRGLLEAIAPAPGTRVLVASTTDTDLERLAASRGSTEDVWLAASAERALEEADRVRRALQQLGAEAVAAGPEALPPAVSDRYLALKAAGRL